MRRRAAGLAFYTAFSLAPMLLLLTLATGALYSGMEEEIVGQVTQLVPGTAGDAVTTLLAGLRTERDSGLAALAGLITLAFGATGVFTALQDALNEIGGADQRPFSWWSVFTQRLLSFAMLAAVAVLLLVSLVANSVMAYVVARFGDRLAGGPGIWHVINLTMAMTFATIIFTLLFKLVPINRVPWLSALIAGGVTAVLFNLGGMLLAWYFGTTARLSIYGAFGSLIVLLLWVYYSAQIVLFGAAVAKNCAEEFS